MMGKKFLCFFLAAVMMFSSQAAAEGAKKASLSFTKVRLKVGQRKKIVIKNKNKKAKYSYKSSSPKKAAVSKKGVITAKKKGSANITVTEKIAKKSRKAGVVKVICTGRKAAASNVPEGGQAGTQPAPTGTPSDVLPPTEAPAAQPTAVPTEAPTKAPDETPEPTPDLYTTKVTTVEVADDELYTVDGNTCKVDMQYFSGSASGDYVKGDVSGQGSTVFKEYKEDGRVEYCARYIINDDSGTKFFIEDNGTKDASGAYVGKPTIITDDNSLAWLGTADLQSRVRDNGNGGKSIDIMWNESNTDPVPPPAVKYPDDTKDYSKEMFTFLIDIGASENVDGGSYPKASMIHFQGSGEGEYFNGKVVHDSVDTRMQFEGQVQTLSARYILEGTDANGNPCMVYVENNGIDDNGMVTEPTIITDCPDYAWIESAPLHGTVSWDPQLTIHMWTTEDAFANGSNS